MYAAVLRARAPARLAPRALRMKASLSTPASATSAADLGVLATPHIVPSEDAKHILEGKRIVQSSPHRITAMNSYEVTAPHHRTTKNSDGDYTLSHAIYTKDEVEAVGNNLTHYPEVTLKDKAALAVLKVIRVSFDTVTGYGKNMTADKYLTRMIMLETIAAIPGMVGAMWRHFTSLRTMKRDNGMIHTLLEEAENERMHLLVFLELKKPGPLMRAAVLAGQGVVTNLYTLAYLLSPSACHRFVGYLEEEAVKTYTKCLGELDDGKLPEWKDLPAPEIGIKYWRLDEDAKMKDLILAIRADEAIHRDVNHVFADLKPSQPNPFL